MPISNQYQIGSELKLKLANPMTFHLNAIIKKTESDRMAIKGVELSRKKMQRGTVRFIKVLKGLGIGFKRGSKNTF